MASATHLQVMEVPLDEPAARPLWWRRGHTYAFIAVAAAEVGLTWGVVRLLGEVAKLPPGAHQIAAAAMLGFQFAQCFLLGLWAALGGLRTVPRWLAVGGVTTAGASAVTAEITRHHWPEFFYQMPMLALLGGLTMAGFAVVLLPLRRLAGWRIDFDASYHPSVGRRRGQLDLMDFPALFCAVALPLVLCRSLIDLLGADAADIAVFFPIFGALVLASAAPTAFAILARHGKLVSFVLCALWIAALCFAQSILAARFSDLDVFDGRSTAWAINWTVVAFHGSVVATVTLPLAMLRLVGLKLIVVK